MMQIYQPVHSLQEIYKLSTQYVSSMVMIRLTYNIYLNIEKTAYGLPGHMTNQVYTSFRVAKSQSELLPFSFTQRKPKNSFTKNA